MTAFVRLAFFPGGTATHYRALADALAGAPPPEDRLAFAAGPVPDGWQVVQIWTHRQALDEWNAAWFVPALARVAGAGFPNPPLVHDFTAEDYELRPGPATGDDP